jgi:hypothetical protein
VKEIAVDTSSAAGFKVKRAKQRAHKREEEAREAAAEEKEG